MTEPLGDGRRCTGTGRPECDDCRRLVQDLAGPVAWLGWREARRPAPGKPCQSQVPHSEPPPPESRSA